MKVKNYSWTVAKLHGLHSAIDPRPQYQRGPVWQLKDKQLLIDSILRGFDIPKIYLRKVDSHGYDYETADGQQRLLAIWEFLDDGYALSETCPINGAAGRLFSDLPASIAKNIREFELITAVAYNASSSEIRELFVRLQRGIPLSQPEIRNAIPSQLGDTIRLIAATNPFCVSSPFSADRYKTDDLVAHAFLLELTKGKRDLKAPELRQLYADYAAGADNATERHVVEVLDFLHEMQTAKPKCIIRKWGFVDIYWVVSSLKRQRHSLDSKTFAEKYVAFEVRRLNFVARPEKLLEGKVTRANRNLFDYIEAFKTSGGLSANVVKRHHILTGVFVSQNRAKRHG